MPQRWTTLQAAKPRPSLLALAIISLHACALASKPSPSPASPSFQTDGVGWDKQQPSHESIFNEPSNKYVRHLMLNSSYMSNSQLENSMKALVREYYGIARIYSIGRSFLGVPLRVLEISDKPGKEEAEPSFKYIGNMHGDEPVGRELLLLLAHWLCSNYLKDPLATFIVRRSHVHLLPSMNPDGFSMKRRNNANNVDLNRDFPDQFYRKNNDESLRQPETRAVMNWNRVIKFVASASLHGGALVANYPWDGSTDGSTVYSKCPDDDTFRYFATIYSKFHSNMSSSEEFAGGITNGAAWYPLYGGMQDWSYIHGKCLELTLEISENKWPPPIKVLRIWEENWLSMLQLIANVIKSGVHGIVLSSSTGKPVPATISVYGINVNVTASGKSGYYHRLLRPGGNYTVTASFPGYVSSATTVLVFERDATWLDFVLRPSSYSQAGEQGGPNGIPGHPQQPYHAADTASMGVEPLSSGGRVELSPRSTSAGAMEEELFEADHRTGLSPDSAARHLKHASACFMVAASALCLYLLLRWRGIFRMQRLLCIRKTACL